MGPFEVLLLVLLGFVVVRNVLKDRSDGRTVVGTHKGGGGSTPVKKK